MVATNNNVGNSNVIEVFAVNMEIVSTIQAYAGNLVRYVDKIAELQENTYSVNIELVIDQGKVVDLTIDVSDIPFLVAMT